SQRGLYNLLDNSSNSISIGEMQRISLARILYLDKPILFLDEVTSSLDQKNSEDINNIIKNLDNKLVIWISHNKDVSNLKWIDNKVVIDNRQINIL
ncbi:MAG: ATP-binding cassette domain-containing protein, partial [Firmicutes bacterium]|nr:ATP-binding cassette domain-containing protein [Candidatus Alectryobacillus merdavium]